MVMQRNTEAGTFVRPDWMSIAESSINTILLNPKGQNLSIAMQHEPHIKH